MHYPILFWWQNGRFFAIVLNILYSWNLLRLLCLSKLNFDENISKICFVHCGLADMFQKWTFLSFYRRDFTHLEKMLKYNPYILNLYIEIIPNKNLRHFIFLLLSSQSTTPIQIFLIFWPLSFNHSPSPQCELLVSWLSLKVQLWELILMRFIVRQFDLEQFLYFRSGEDGSSKMYPVPYIIILVWSVSREIFWALLLPFPREDLFQVELANCQSYQN